MNLAGLTETTKEGKMEAQVTVEDLDTATEAYRDGRGQPTEPCRHGHFECSYVEGGKCEAEEVAKLVSR